MKKIISILVTLLTILTSTLVLAEGKELGFPTLKGSYLGQKPPGLKAEPFAPAVLSVPGKNHHTLSFSTDGKECRNRQPQYRPGRMACAHRCRMENSD